MFLVFEDGVYDHDLESLVELLDVIDHQMVRLDVEISSSPDPDGFGYLDRMEGVIGLGFVACQQYIHATYPHLGKKKSAAIQSPPKHSSGRPVAEIINAAANFWKHHDEWSEDSENAGAQKTMDVVKILVPSSVDYMMANVLRELLKPQASCFASVIPLLTQWRDLLIAAHRLT